MASAGRGPVAVPAATCPPQEPLARACFAFWFVRTCSTTQQVVVSASVSWTLLWDPPPTRSGATARDVGRNPSRRPPALDRLLLFYRCCPPPALILYRGPLCDVYLPSKLASGLFVEGMGLTHCLVSGNDQVCLLRYPRTRVQALFWTMMFGSQGPDRELDLSARGGCGRSGRLPLFG